MKIWRIIFRVDSTNLIYIIVCIFKLISNKPIKTELASFLWVEIDLSVYWPVS